MGIVKINKKNKLNRPGRLGGIAAGVVDTDAVNMAQLNALQAEVDALEAGTGSFSAIDVSGTTDSTSGSTGSIITDGGIGAAKAIFAGTSLSSTTTTAVGTALTVGTDITGAKEVDHVVTVATTTTAATVGGKITVKGATGATSGTGGAAELIGGAAGVTAGASGGAVNITGGAEGAGLGVTGAVNITTPAATGGAAGNITAIPGTSSSTTISPIVILGKGVVKKPLDTSLACGTTITAVALVGGNLSITGTTGNITLPTAADITTAIGATPVGTTIEFVVNTVGMTAGNVATVALGANIVTQKMISAGDIATDQLLTVTNTAGINMGIFRLCYISATTCSLHRVG